MSAQDDAAVIREGYEAFGKGDIPAVMAVYRGGDEVLGLFGKLQELSGGSFRPDPAAVFAEDERTASKAVPLWPWLVVAAALVFIVDVALRRIDLDLMLGRSKPPMKMVMRR